MHIPDGFLSRRGRRARRRGGRRRRSRVCVRARRRRGARARPARSPGSPRAFFLVGDAPMFPVTVGTQGHLLGGTLAVALLGPWLGAMTIAVVCADPGARARRRRHHDARAEHRQPRAGAGVRRLPAAARAAPACCPPRRAGSRSRAGSRRRSCVLLAAGDLRGEFALGARRADRPARAGRQHARRLRGDRGRSRASSPRSSCAALLGRAARPRARGRAARAGARRSRPRARRAAEARRHERPRVRSSAPGPGAPDLLTLRAVRVLGEADVVVWARSLVDEAILEHARAGRRARRLRRPHATTTSSPIYARAARDGLRVARVHSGDPTLYGALHEQIDACRRLGLATRSSRASARWPAPRPRSGRS